MDVAKSIMVPLKSHKCCMVPNEKGNMYQIEKGNFMVVPLEILTSRCGVPLPNLNIIIQGR